MDGNSLGAAPATVGRAVDAALDTWRRSAVRGWNDAGWLELPFTVGDRIGELIGAAAGQVVACDSTSVNLFKALHCAVAMSGGPISYLRDEFPTDRFIADHLGAVRRDRVEELVGGHAVLLSHVDYRTGELRHMEAVTAAVHAAGGTVVWDLSHSAGAVPAALDAGGADFAVGCGYKFLNGGPGAPAWIYVARRHQEAVRNPIPGWFGDADTFAFGDAYVPAGGIRRMLTGTPSVLGLAALSAGIEAFRETTIFELRRRSLELSDLVIDALDRLGLELVTPREQHRRGSHVAARHPRPRALASALLAAGVVVDTRPPDLVRFGITPLTLDADDVAEAMRRLAVVLESELPESATADIVP